MDLISTGTWCELETRGASLLLDGCGIGISIYDQLRAKGRGDVHAIIVSERAKDPERFYNLRAELFYNLKVMFEKGLIDLSQLDQETYQKLKGQLSTIKFSFRAGRMLLESKEDLRKRGLPSPDLADSLALSFAREGTCTWSGPLVLGESVAASMIGRSWESSPDPEPERASPGVGLMQGDASGMPPDGIW